MKKNKSDVIFKCVFALLAAVYVFAVIKVTFLKDGVRHETNMFRLVPFGGINEYKMGFKSAASIVVNYLGNVVLFFPAGVFLPLFFRKLKLLKTALIGALLSVIIEITQYIMSCGYADVDDVLMNTLGAAIGAAVYLYVLRGKKKTVLSYVLSLILIISVELGGAMCVWYVAPNLLPDDMIVINNMIAGRKLDGYDVRLNCYKMSRGEVFVVGDTSEDSRGNKLDGDVKSYYIADTAIFVIESEQNESTKYHIVGKSDFIDAFSENKDARLKLWLSENAECNMLMLEK